MENTLLSENDSKRLNLPLRLLIFFAPYSIWQMGATYFSGEALSIGGRTPLPVDVGNLSALLSAGYILAIVYVFFFNRYSVITARIVLFIALVCAASLYLPLPPELLGILYCTQIFCCIALTAILITIAGNLYTETTAIKDAIITLILSGVVIAILHNDFKPMSFNIFLPVIIICISSVLFYTCKLPARTWLRYVKKEDNLIIPKRLLIQMQTMVGLSSLMTMFGTVVAESVPHGVSVYFISSVIGAVIIAVLWKYFNIAPLRCVSPFLAIGALGFLVSLISINIPAFSIAASVLAGFGMTVCCLSSYFIVVILRRYPSRYMLLCFFAIAVLGIFISSALLDTFRDNLPVLYICYLSIAVSITVIYLVIEPHLTYSFNKNQAANNNEQLTRSGEQPAVNNRQIDSLKSVGLQDHAFDKLSYQEQRIAELILRGYSYTEIAGALKLKPNTVKWYQKELYSKLGINSKRELFELAGSR